MQKAILIDAIIRDQPRVAITEKHNHINYLDLEAHKERTKGNIYVGVVSKITNAFEAAFVNYGNDKHGFLSFKDLAPIHKKKRDDGSEEILIKEGQKILVQIEKERRGDKGAALTTLISLAGNYLVIMPGNPNCSGISKRIETGERDQTKAILDNLPLPPDMGIIMRTAGVSQPEEELLWDLSSLINQWQAIESTAAEFNNPTLIYQESDSILRSLRDHLKSDVAKIVVNDESTFEHVKKYISTMRPDFIEKVHYYDNSKMPLFTHYQIEPQIEKLFDRKIDLASGGSIIIEQCEALTAIDVNSGGATQGQDIEETAYRTNLEAVAEAAMQIKLRNISGIIDIDLIDMSDKSKRSEVEKALQKAFQHDKSKIKSEPISSLTGCLRISRQRNGASLTETHQEDCHECHGTGRVRSLSSFGTQLLRKVEEYIAEEATDIVMLQVNIDVCTYIVNELRAQLDRIQKTYNTYVMVVPNEYFDRQKHSLKRMRMPAGGTAPSSIEEKTQPQSNEQIPDWSTAHRKDQPKVAHVASTRQKSKKDENIFKQFISWIFTSDTKKAGEKKSSSDRNNKRSRRHSSRGPRQNTTRQSSQPTQMRRSRGPRRQRSERPAGTPNKPHHQDKPYSHTAKSVDLLDD